ncbi:MAG: CRISPR-associated protein Csm5 [Thermosipho sp. (in: thermotogales)]|nr:CRISPR-associated protein Csm5 [Thermosipho sp. (in: thermotogales)]
MNNKIFSYEIEVLSPLAITSGEEIQSFEILKIGNRNFVLDFLNLLENEKKFVDLLVNHPEILDNPVYLKNWLEKLKIDYRKYIKLEFYGELKRNLKIKEFIKSAGKAYIPGSSIKGALRTLLIKANNLHKEYNEELKKVKNCQLKEYDDEVEKALFGNSYYSPFKFLRVSDSESIDYSYLNVEFVEVINLKKSKRVIPLYFETLKKGTKLYGTLDFGRYYDIVNSEFSENFKKLNILQNFIQKIRAHVSYYIDSEIKLFRENKSLKPLVSFYKYLRDIKLNENEFIFQLGSSTGYKSKAVIKLDDDAIRKLKELFERQQKGKKYRIKINQELFPITRRVIKVNESEWVTMGWVKMKLSQRN